jgi:DNA-binding LacI/PurR family transcriptional regulator/DNA-binding transcriptional regulator YhcF (GntR family)
MFSLRSVQENPAMNSIDQAVDIAGKRLQSGIWIEGERMPSLMELAKICNVSRTTMWRALARLKADGKVHATRGGAIIAGPEGVAGIVTSRPETVLEHLKSRIADEIRSGVFLEAELPPVTKLARKYGVAFDTLKKALCKLNQEGVLLREGRRFRLDNGQPRLHRSTIVLFTSGDRERGLFLNEHRTQTVVETFERECRRLGFEGVIESYDESTPSCLLQASTFIKGIRDPAGFMVNIWNPWDSTQLKRWFDLFQSMIDGERPVVVLDQATDITFSAPLLRSRFFRVLRIAGVRAGEMVARELIREGHTRVAYLSSYFNQSWSKDRYAGLSAFFRNHGGPRSVVEPFAQNDLTGPDDLVVALLGLDKEQIRNAYHGISTPEFIKNLLEKIDQPEIIRAAQQMRNDPVARTIRPVVHTMAGMAGSAPDPQTFFSIQLALLHIADHSTLAQYQRALFERVAAESTATAWVCSDETTALAALMFLRKRGVGVPDDISVIGFENRPESQKHQLSTYDFDIPGMVQQALQMILDKKELKNRRVISEVDGCVVKRRTTRS